jgi:hypothetical protein
MPDTLYLPLAEHIERIWPRDLLEPPPVDQIKGVWIEPLNIQHEPSLHIRAGMLFEQELALNIPGIDGLQFFFAASGSDTAFMFEFDSQPTPVMRVVDVPAGLRFSGDLLRPARRVPGTGGQPDRIEADPNAQHLDITLAKMTLSIDFEGNLGIATDAGLNLPLCLIGETGVALEASNIQFIGRHDTPPAGKPAGWRGVYIPVAKLYLPGELAGTVGNLEVRDAYIGNGGFSGRTSLTFSPARSTKLLGVSLSLEGVELEFVQNVPVASTLRGKIQLPFFDQPVNVEIGIGLDGSFQVKLAGSNGLYTLEQPDVVKVELDSLGFRASNGKLAAILSGKLTPLYGSNAGLTWPAFDVRELAIDSDGNVQLEGGWLQLRKQYTLDLYGFHLEITKLGFGKNQDGSKWIGCSGGVKFVDGFSAGVSAEGLRITWGGSGGVRLSMEGIGVEFATDAIKLKGKVALTGPTGFDGQVRVELPTLSVVLDGAISIGKGTDGQPYFAVYLDASFPTGFPLGSSGVGLYGIAGLFAMRKTPKRADGQSWYDWYKAPTTGVTEITGGKWAYDPDGLALGAGVTLGTWGDNGYAFNGKVLLLIAFPGPVIMLEGQANMLTKRSELGSGEPLFRLYGVLDPLAESILFALDAQYKYDQQDGSLLDIRGGAEAFFSWGDRKNWHIYLGQKDPREKRIRAEIFRLFSAEAYLMLSQSSLQLGARVGWDKSWKFGPLRVYLEAWIEANAAVSWAPPHFHGDVAIHGAAGLEAFGFGLSLSIDTTLSADVLSPYHIAGSLDVRINLPWPLPDPKATIRLEWGPEKELPPLPLPLQDVSIEHPLVSTTWRLPRGQYLLPNYDSNTDGYLTIIDPNENPVYEGRVEPADLTQLSAVPVVPLDARPTLTFSRPMQDDAFVGVFLESGAKTEVQVTEESFEYIGDPDKRSGPAKVRYALERVTLQRWQADNTWTTLASAPQADSPARLFGSWAAVPATANLNNAQTSQVKLQLWAKSSYFYARVTGNGDDWAAANLPNKICAPPPADQQICYNFNNIDLASPPRTSWTSPDGVVRLGWFEYDRSEVRQNSAGETVLYFGALTPSVPWGDSLVGRFLHVRLSRPIKKITFLLDGPWTEPYYVVQVDDRGDSAGGFGYIDPPTTTPPPTSIEIEGNNTIRLVFAMRNLSLKGICVTFGASYQEIERRGEIQNHVQQMVSTLYQEDDVLEPFRIYRLKIETKLDVQFEGELTGGVNPYRQIEYAYFQTGGAPGLSELSRPVDVQAASFDSGLKDLSAYVDHTVPASKNTKDGDKPLLSRPVYRAYDVSVAFKANYVDQLYRMSFRTLALYLFDQNNRPARDTLGRLVTLNNTWDKDAVTELRKDEQQSLTFLQSGGCIELDLDRRPRNDQLKNQAGYLLEPESYYEARLLPLLLHEDFRRYVVGGQATSGNKLGRWSVTNQVSSGEEPVWEVIAVGDARAIKQNAGTGDDSTNKNGALLLYSNTADLPSGEQAKNWTDYRINLYMSAGSASGAIGVVYSYSLSSSYRYTIGPNYLRLERRSINIPNGLTTTTLAEQTQGFTLQANRSYHVSIEVLRTGVRVFQDGVLIFNAKSPATKGHFGLYTWKNPGATFQDIQVDNLHTDAKAAYRFQFITSRFANFYHHLHSAGESLWSQEPVPALPGDLTGFTNASTSNPNSTLSGTEAAKYEEFAGLVLGSAARQHVTAMEYTRVVRRDGAGNPKTAALLVRSPEPISWVRSALTCHRTVEQMVIGSVSGPVKLAQMSFVSSSPNSETVSLLLLKGADLSGARLEWRARGSAGPWSASYTFGQEAKWASGTRVVIYSGNGGTPPAAPPNVVQRFRASGSDAGAAVLPVDGVELRLVGPDGAVWHQREFVAGGRYTSASVKVLRKADGTGFVLFPSAPGNLTPGSYRLLLRFERDLGEPELYPVLSEAGSSSAESVVVDLPFVE